jgi:hypothetical protein
MEKTVITGTLQGYLKLEYKIKMAVARKKWSRKMK